MNLLNTDTDHTVLTELGARMAQVRLSQNLTQAALATEAGVSKRTIERLESGAVGTQLSGFVRVCRALGLLDRLGLLVPETTPSPMAQLKLHGKTRQRARGPALAAQEPAAHYASGAPTTKWTWGEPE